MQVNGMTEASAIHIDVIGDKDGSDRARTLGTASILGIFPHTLDTSLKAEGHCGTFHVDIEAGTTYVRDVESGATIFKGRGFAKTMQALADTYGVDVVVGHDPGASSPISNARYVTSNPVEAEAEAAPVAEAEAVHAIGREAMFCGLPMDAPVRAFTRMSYVTCEACKAAAPVIRTANGAVITDGLAVFDYDLNPGRVNLASLNTDGWFDVIKADGSRSVMDGSRVVTVWNGQTAEAALTPAPVESVPVPVPVPVFTAETEAEVSVLDAIFGPVSDDCVCDSILSAGPSHEERECPGCGSVFGAVPRVAVSIGDKFTDTAAGVTVTVAAVAFLGCPDVLFSEPGGTFFRVSPMLLACRVRDGEYVRQTRPGHLVTSTPVRTLMRRRARKAARKAARVGR